MYKITNEQIDYILNDIEKKGVKTEDVRFNILDHVCCIIENEMQSGMNFKQFYRDTIARFYHKELKEIEDETRKLITFKYYHAMRRTLKFTGVVTVLLCLVGTIFKLLHWPGAGILILLGLGIFGLIFIPLNIIMKFRDEKENTNKFIITFGFVLGILITIGFIFKIFHWPGANVMIISSLALFGLFFIPIYFFSRYRNPETKFNAIVHTTFMVAGAGLLFSMFDVHTSKTIENSVVSTVDYQEVNVTEFQSRNELLYSEFEKDGSLSHSEIKNVTEGLTNIIENIETNLISKSNNISFDEAKDLSYIDLINPNDFSAVKIYFGDAKGEYSYINLINSIEEYNLQIEELDTVGILRTIDISNLKMKETFLSIVLSNLVDIKIQILSNENSYLCYQKGINSI